MPDCSGTQAARAKPVLDAVERRRILKRLQQDLAWQAAEAKSRVTVGHRAEQLHCPAFAASLIERHGAAVFAPVLQCARDAKGEVRFTACVAKAAAELARRGVLSGPEHGRLTACAAILDADALKRLAQN
jgi:hypothetical protein